MDSASKDYALFSCRWCGTIFGPLYEYRCEIDMDMDMEHDLLIAFKMFIGEQQRNDNGKHECDCMLRNMSESLHATLSKKGVDLCCAKEGNEVWDKLNVSEAFMWLTKCVMAVSTENKGLFAFKRNFLHQGAMHAGHAGLEMGLEESEAARFIEALDRPLGLDANEKGWECLELGSLDSVGELQ